METDHRHHDSSSAARQPVFFVTHVPKCCGTSLRYILKEGLSIKDTRFYWPGKVKSGVKAGMSAITGQHPSDFDYIVGHYPWGVHWLLRPWSQVARRPKIHIATLRDPIDQMISYYYYHLQLGHRSPFRECMEKVGDIVDFYSLATAAQNQQTKAYAGLPYAACWQQALRFYDADSLLKKAIKHLTFNYDYWIHQSFFRESIDHLANSIGMPLAIMKADETVTKARLRPKDYSIEVLHRLAEINYLDIRLHESLNSFYLDKMGIDCGKFSSL